MVRKVSRGLYSVQEHSNNLWVPVVLTAIIYGALIYAQLATHDYEPSHFVVAGKTFYDAASAHSSLRLIYEGDGYDGQFYYRLAIEPFTRKYVDHGIRFDGGAYRQQRILYPLLAWIISAGRPARIPAALIILNYLGLCLIAWLGASIARDLARHALWGIVFSLYPGFILTLARDLTEIVASTFLLAGLLLARRSHNGGSAACLSCAVLARETTLPFSVAMILKLIIKDRADEKRVQYWYYLIPIFCYLVWRTYLRFIWNEHSQILGDVIGTPFRGVGNLWLRAFAAPTFLLVAWCIETCMIGLLAIYAFRMFNQHKGFLAENISLILSTALVVCLTEKHWGEDWAFLRASTEICLMGCVGILLDRKRKSLAVCVVWILAAVFTIAWRID